MSRHCREFAFEEREEMELFLRFLDAEGLSHECLTIHESEDIRSYYLFWNEND